ncbi:hypothetical protein BC628DRAFT_1016153 [Trametes gibbosa]|nr:hypothetical protein BC628DRAFT_1016153 [Trametes gibbosa]
MWVVEDEDTMFGVGEATRRVLDGGGTVTCGGTVWCCVCVTILVSVAISIAVSVRIRGGSGRAYRGQNRCEQTIHSRDGGSSPIACLHSEDVSDCARHASRDRDSARVGQADRRESKCRQAISIQGTRGNKLTNTVVPQARDEGRGGDATKDTNCT